MEKETRQGISKEKKREARGKGRTIVAEDRARHVCHKAFLFFVCIISYIKKQKGQHCAEQKFI
jgi:hypothetical protein